MRKAPPPFSYAVNGNRQIFPRPTDMEMQDKRNSILRPQTGLPVPPSSSSAPYIEMWICFNYVSIEMILVILTSGVATSFPSSFPVVKSYLFFLAYKFRTIELALHDAILLDPVLSRLQIIWLKHRCDYNV